MSIHVALSHSTRYRYDRPVALSPHVVRLRPAPHCRTPVLSYSMKVEPRTQFLNWQQDPHGNYLARVVFPEKARELTVDVDLVVEMSVINPFDFFLEPSAEMYPFTYEPWLAKDLIPFLGTAPVGTGLCALLKTIDRVRKRRWTSWSLSTSACRRTIRYLIRSSRACRRPRRRSRPEAARAATRDGCSCRCSVISDWRRGSSRAI
jgi:transglutaminase-like putative cysteine protease